MAKKKKTDDDILRDGNLDEEEEGGKIGGAIIAIIIVAIWLAIFILLIKLDVGGFGSSVLRPILKDVPVLNWILPEVTDEQAAQESGYKYRNLAEAIERIKELEAENALLRENVAANEQTISDLYAEVARLKEFEEYQKNYIELKRKFDEEVVFNDKAPDIKEYKAWYEKLDKENAAAIYQKVLEQIQYSEQVKQWAEAYAKMDAEAAAAILEEMTPDLDKVKAILMNMESKNRAAILAAMDPVFAAKVTVDTAP